MGQAQRDLPRSSEEETDVAQVVHALRRFGPRPLDELLDDPYLEGWSTQRLEGAVVSAWSRNLISIDAGDLLVAL
jgi:hypothetical protein